MAHALQRDRTHIITHGDALLDEAQWKTFQDSVIRRAGHEPLQYITGHQYFFGLDFAVTPDVLIPRPETELLVESASELIDGAGAPLICDVGTGSGCIAIALLHALPRARAFGTDVSTAALSLAARNASQIGVGDRFDLVLGDCLDPFSSVAARFDLIVSNPPYVAEHDLEGLQREVRDYEPRIALTPGGDGLAVIRRL